MLTRRLRAPMPPRPDRPDSSEAKQIALPGAVIRIRNTGWFRPLRPGVTLSAGEVAPELLRIPVKDAEAVMRGIIHLVADIAADTRPIVVWVAGDDELLVQLDATRLTCAPGFVTVSLFVTCDEVRNVQRIDIPFAVGSPQRPAGLVMTTFERPQGPTVILDTWSASITAFAWETVVTTAKQLTAGLGKDRSGKPLVPSTIAADTNLLLVGAMARNKLTWSGQ